MDGPSPTLEHFGQVTLPSGAVVDGEVVDVDAVATAVKRLWAEAGFSSRRVVVGVSSQRVIVRQAEIVEMSERELRSSLQFQAADLIPIPVEEAILDFSLIAPDGSAVQDPENPKMRILLVAAQRTMVAKHLAVLTKAGLQPVAVDAVALALLRAMPSDEGEAPEDRPMDAEAVVSIGADLTTIAVREDGVVRLVRVIGIGGSNLTDLVSSEMGIALDVAEGFKRRGSGGSAVAVLPGPTAVTRHVDALVTQVRGSIDFYRAQKNSKPVGRIVLTGGGAQIEGAFEQLRASLGDGVELSDPLRGIQLGQVGLSAEQIQQAAPYLLASIGLALWGSQPGLPITLLPDEVRLRRRRKQRLLAAGCAAALVLAVLVLSLSSGGGRVSDARSASRAENHRVAQLTSNVATLGTVSSAQAELAARTQVYQAALKNNVDWVNLLAQIAAVMPRSAALTSFTGSGIAGAPAIAAPAGSAASDGQVAMSVTALGGFTAVADWLRAMAVLPGLSNIVVASESQTQAGPDATGPPSINFSATANVTPAAESKRSSQIPGAP